jgi:hypothetical protein
MLRILGRVSIYGSKASTERLASLGVIPSGELRQVGQKRAIPDEDSWFYASPWYRFHIDVLDEEANAFLRTHSKLGSSLAVRDSGIRHAIFTLCPVEQTEEEVFAFMLSSETLKLLSNLGLALEVSPAAVMPDAQYWVGS